MKFNMKTIVPIFLALIFLGSVLAVFTYGGKAETGKAEIIVDFGQPNMVYKSVIDIAENTSAMRFLSSYATKIELENGQVDCIADYCNTNSSKWNFYVVESGGYGEKTPAENPEEYIVQFGDSIRFRYEWAKTEEPETGSVENINSE